MPKIFEIFGYRINDDSEEAKESREHARCPFMGCECDGGGNRYLSHINLSQTPELQSLYPGRETIPSGVCSLQLREGEMPWIVCPRRLLALGKQEMGERRYQTVSENLLIEHCGYSQGSKIGVWPEVKVKYTSKNKNFDYTFDYVLFPLGRMNADELIEITGCSWNQLSRDLTNAGYSMAMRDGAHYVEDFPVGDPIIIEIMTSSTSGGNKRKRSTIPLAFEDAILDQDHTAPGINYRQVWARMVSQLVVKSEVAMSWGGKTFWILQDHLVNYISSSTALDIFSFLSKTTSEVNILCLSYGDEYKKDETGVAELKEGKLYSGPIRPAGIASDDLSFQDMIRAPVFPPKTLLFKLLSKRLYTNVLVVRPA